MYVYYMYMYIYSYAELFYIILDYYFFKTLKQ